jgi:hypothetical protein
MRALRIAASIFASVVTALANSGMCFAPKLDELIKVLRRYLNDVLHIASACISRPNCVISVCQCNLFHMILAEL